MSGGAYTNTPERRIRHIRDILTSGPRTFDAVVVGAGVAVLKVLHNLLPRRLDLRSGAVTVGL